MKEKYSGLEMETVTFETQDVIVTSCSTYEFQCDIDGLPIG